MFPVVAPAPVVGHGVGEAPGPPNRPKVRRLFSLDENRELQDNGVGQPHALEGAGTPGTLVGANAAAQTAAGSRDCSERAQAAPQPAAALAALAAALPITAVAAAAAWEALAAGAATPLLATAVALPCYRRPQLDLHSIVLLHTRQRGGTRPRLPTAACPVHTQLTLHR